MNAHPLPRDHQSHPKNLYGQATPPTDNSNKDSEIITPPISHKKSKFTKTGIITTLALVIGMAATVHLTQQPQDIRQQARELVSEPEFTLLVSITQNQFDETPKVNQIRAFTGKTSVMADVVKQSSKNPDLYINTSGETPQRTKYNMSVQSEREILHSEELYVDTYDAKTLSSILPSTEGDNKSNPMDYLSAMIEIPYSSGSQIRMLSDDGRSSIEISEKMIQEAINNNLASVASPITKRVWVLEFNPYIMSMGGAKLSEAVGWHDPQQLEQTVIDSFRNSTGGVVNYTIVGRSHINLFPKKADGFIYTEQEYLNCINRNGPCRHPDLVDYNLILSQYGICNRLNEGVIDELWLWGGPYFGYYEANMAGPYNQVFHTNGPPIHGNSCSKALSIMGFNYERIDGILHNEGHRMEGTLRRLIDPHWRSYGPPPKNIGSTLPNKLFRRSIDIGSNYSSGCGHTHGVINSATWDGSFWSYDYSSNNTRMSNCVSWYNYPDYGSQVQNVSCSNWGCYQAGYLRYLFSKIPKFEGWANGIRQNWWYYYLNPQAVIEESIANQKDLENLNLIQSQTPCVPWVVTCNDMTSYEEKFCEIQRLFHDTWGDGFSRWRYEACQNHGGVYGGGSANTCDNNVPQGGTACQFSGDTNQYRCTNPSAAPSSTQWTQEPCNPGNTCQGTSCTTQTVTCNQLASRFRLYQNGTDLGWVSTGTYTPLSSISTFETAVFIDGNTSNQYVGEVRLTAPNGTVTTINGQQQSVPQPWQSGTYRMQPFVNGSGCTQVEVVLGANPTSTPAPTPTPAPLPAPQNFTVIFNPDTNISTLSWANQSGAINYRVERCSGVNCTNFTQIASPTSSPYTVSVPSGQTHRYRLRSFNGSFSPHTNIIDSSVSWNITTQAICSNGATPTQQTRLYYAPWPPTPLSWTTTPWRVGSHTLNLTSNHSWNNYYIYMQGTGGVGALQPSGGSPHPAITYGQYFNPSTWMAKLNRNSSNPPVLPSGSYTINYQAPDSWCQLPEYKVFVTSTTRNGNLGGLTGADTICQQRASTAGLSGTYRAWLSTSTTNAQDRIPHAIYALTNGSPIANHKQELLSGNILSGINRNEFGAVSPNHLTFTGTNESGNSASLPNCQNWTSTTGFGTVGHPGYTNHRWTRNASASCSNSRPIFCFQVGE